jgi:hypothetical protein
MTRSASILRRFAATAAIGIAGTAWASTIEAQAADDILGRATGSGWMTNWAPYALSSDLPRTPGRPLSEIALVEPLPRTGLFWTGRNPGALAFELDDSWSDFRLQRTNVSGEYRRPLDAERVTRNRLSALGWTPVGDATAMIGGVVAERYGIEGAPSVVLMPNGSSPFVAADTAGPSAQRTVVRIYGAIGRRIGRVGLGASVAYEAHDDGTRRYGVPRTGRAVLPAASVGAVADVGGGVMIGGYARRSDFAETARMVPLTGVTHVYVVHGYGEPQNIELASPNTYFVRFDQEVHAFGANVGADWAGLSWNVLVESSALLRLRSTSLSSTIAPTDTWRTDGWTLGAAVRRRLGPTMWTVEARGQDFIGSAQLADAEEHYFATEESSFGGSVEARVLPRAATWTAAVRFQIDYERRQRVDQEAELYSELENLAPGLAVAVAGMVGGRVTVSGEGSFTSYATRGAVPAASEQAAGYRHVMAPDLAILATPAKTWTASIGARYPLREGTELSFGARHESLAPAPPGATLPFLPAGRRSATTLQFGVSRSR